MAGSRSYRAGVQSGINWRKTLKSFDSDNISKSRRKLKRVKKESRLDMSDWKKGFNVGYKYERSR